MILLLLWTSEFSWNAAASWSSVANQLKLEEIFWVGCEFRVATDLRILKDSSSLQESRIVKKNWGGGTLASIDMVVSRKWENKQYWLSYHCKLMRAGEAVNICIPRRFLVAIAVMFAGLQAILPFLTISHGRFVIIWSIIKTNWQQSKKKK